MGKETGRRDMHGRTQNVTLDVNCLTLEYPRVQGYDPAGSHSMCDDSSSIPQPGQRVLLVVMPPPPAPRPTEHTFGILKLRDLCKNCILKYLFMGVRFM